MMMTISYGSPNKVPKIDVSDGFSFLDISYVKLSSFRKQSQGEWAEQRPAFLPMAKEGAGRN